MKRALILGLLVLLCWFGTALSGQAQVGNLRLENRVRRLESEISRVRSQLTQLASQLTNSQIGELTPLNDPPTGFLGDPSLEEQFDNLATLAIELKQRVRALESRVNQLEGEHSQ